MHAHNLYYTGLNYSIVDILFLHTFNALGDIEEFREDAKDGVGRLIPFPGPGELV